MAIQNPDKFASTAGAVRGLRYSADSIQPKTFATGSATLAPLSPVAYNTSTGKHVLFQNGGANGTGTITGFLMDELVLHASNDQIANVMLTGRVHLDDIPIQSGYNLAQLKTALAIVKTQGIIVEGLPEFH